MIATDSSCLTAEQLRDVAGGRLPTHRFTELLEHLDACPECQNRAETALESDDSLADALAAPPPADPLAAEADCLAALHRAATHRDFPAVSSTPPVDRLGPYKLIRPLGSGGMGAVFLAEHTRLRRRCAIKLLPRDRGFDASWRDRFDREMAAVAALNDPHIVSATDAGEAAGWHYLVMEYLDGLDLSRLAGRLGPLDVSDACELVRQAAVGLAHIHASGLVHRDIKPSNLMLTRDGVVKILDLGLVLSGTDPLPADNRLTTVGQLMGTLAYMAPEQLIDSTAVDHRADLYALGATLYRLLTGAAPHAAARGLAPLVIAKTAKGAPAITDHRSDLPEPLTDLVTRLLDPAPHRRPQSASEVAATLEPLAAPARPDRLVAAALRRPASDEESVAATPLVAPQTSDADQPPRRRRFAIFAAAAALPLLLIAGIVITIQTDRGDLVIESDQPGLTVAVEQGEEVVEELQLETGENRVTLRSGTYTVTLNTPADGLSLSDDIAAITRGGETVLRVRRERTPEAPSTTGTTEDGPLYRGQTLDEWLAVLEIERAVETVIEAMRAVIALVKDQGAGGSPTETGESAGFRVAKAVLRAARRFGGIVTAGGGGTPSQRFMDAFLQSFPALLPDSGLEAISQELAAGNRESAMAAIWMLNNYVTRTSISPAYQVKPYALERWSESEPGREKLRTLSANLDQAVERLGGYDSPQGPLANEAVTMAYQVRLHLDELLGVDPREDPAIRDRLSENLRNVAAEYRRLFSEADESIAVPLMPSSHRLLEQEVEAARGNVDPALLAWIAIPHLLTTETSSRKASHAFFNELVDDAPVATADAIVTTMAMTGPTSWRYARRMNQLWQQAIEHASQFTSRPQFGWIIFQKLALHLFTGKRSLEMSREAMGTDEEATEQEMRQLFDVLEAAMSRLQGRIAASAPDADSGAVGDDNEAVDPPAANADPAAD